MEQPSIFDASFEDVSHIRRRALLSIILKIYIWTGIILYGISLITTLFKSISLLIQYPSTLQNLPWVMQVSTTILSAGIVIFMTTSLWFEKKWAIRYNWIGGGFYGLFLFLALFTGMMGVVTVMIALCTIPYWYFLYQVQEQWEDEAIKG